jgi:predicted permease
MRPFDKLRLRFRSLFRRAKVNQELDTEFRFHLDQLTEEHMACGMAPAEARRAALRGMGGISQLQEECRDMRGVNYLEDLRRDIRYAARNLRRSPGFAILSVLILSLGIGANTAVFSVVNAVLLKPLAFRDPDRIVTLWVASTAGQASTVLSRQASIADFQDWHDQSSSFEAMAFYASRESAVIPHTTAEYARVTRVSPEFFHVFAVEPIAGRQFTADEVKPGSTAGLMISYAYWQSHFGGDPGALGRTVRVFGSRQITGVLPPGFRFPDNTDLWVPAARGGGSEPRTAQNYLVIGRRKPGFSVEQAQSGMNVIAARLAQQYPESNRDRSVTVTRLADAMVGDVRFTLYLLLGAVGVVLLIACANTATLLLGKATARTREVAVRATLGASRQRIVRQLVAESLLLAILAGAAGLLLAWWGSKALVALAPADLPRLAETAIDRLVLAFTFGISMITSLLSGLTPALYASRVDLNDALKLGGTRTIVGGGPARMRGTLVVAEVALAVMLLCGAGLLIKSFIALSHVGLGYGPENVLVMRATVPAPPAVATVRARQFFHRILAQIAALPGVVAAGATMAPPGYVDSTGTYFVDSLPAKLDLSKAPSVVLSIVAPGTFAALRIPLKRGRDFSESDTADKPFVAVVNEALARRAFVGQDPIGRTIFCPFDSSKGMTIIGVVGDVRQRGPAREPMPECYMTYQQHAFNGNALSIVTRTMGDPAPLTETVRRLAQQGSPDVPMKFTTMEATLAENIAAPRFRTLLFALFAGLAVSLAMAGVYGVIACAVGQRANEIGLRIALGASTGSVLRLILGQGLALAALGLTLGLAAAVAGTRLLTTMLFQVRPNDPLVYLAVAGGLAMVALAAGYVPARRASRIDPVAAIRQQ